MKLLTTVFLFIVIHCHAQFHEDNIARIIGVEEAESYANRYREVHFGLVNVERDPFLFEGVNLEELPSYVGHSVTIYNRQTKFLKDTVQEIAHVQVIEFEESVRIDSQIIAVKDSIQSEINKGTTYWDLHRVFGHFSFLRFSSEPLPTDQIEAKYNISMKTLSNEFVKLNDGNDQLRGFILADQLPHLVPAFIVISFNKAG